MNNKRLSIVEVSNKPTEERRLSSRRVKRQEMQAKYERLWLIKPEQFDPTRNCMERERLERTLQLIQSHLSLSGKRVVDIGCGNGTLAKRLRDAGAVVQAVDIASNALKQLQQHDAADIETLQDALPETSLPDNTYDLVVCTEVIAELNAPDYRLFFAELARLVKPTGYVVCSTPLDIHSEDALQRLSELAHTEFNVIEWVYSYHALYQRLIDFISAPGRYSKAYRDTNYRLSELQTRTGFNRMWFRWNSLLLPALFWVPLSYITNPLADKLSQSRFLMLKLESISRFFSDISGITHAIFIGQRRPLEIPDRQHQPIERPKKREVWE